MLATIWSNWNAQLGKIRTTTLESIWPNLVMLKMCTALRPAIVSAFPKETP